MSPTLLILISFAVLAAILVVTLVAVLREKRALGRFVESAVDFDAVKDAITNLPSPHQDIAAQMVDAINVRSTLDEALTKAVVRTTNETLEPPLARRLITNVLLAFVLFAPLSVALLQTADRVVHTVNETRARPSAVVYLEGQAQLEAPFRALRDVFQSAALLVAGLAALWALRWWLLRPEIREARLIRALLECATRLRPGVAAPVSARLSELVAPDRGLGRPITASAIWFVAVTAGWLLFYGTATVKAANASDPIFEVWPTTKNIGTSDLMVLPAHRAGAPLDATPRPSLAIDAYQVKVQQTVVTELAEDGSLPEEWALTVIGLEKTVSAYDPLEPIVLAHQATPTRTLVEVLRELKGQLGARRFHLIQERTLRTADGTTKRLQADIPVTLGPAEANPALTMRILESGVMIVEEAVTLPFSDPTWTTKVREAIRLRRELFETEARSPLEVRTSMNISYQRLVEVLSAADTACMGSNDCGLPGLGLQIVIQPL